MEKNKFLVCFGVLFLCMLSIQLVFAAGDSVVGRWDVVGNLNVKLLGEQGSNNFADTFVFKSNGNFRTIETGKGKWTQKNSGRFIAQLKENEVKKVMNNYFKELGYPEIRVSKVSYGKFIGVVRGNKIRNGKIKMKFYISASAYGIKNEKVIVTGGFTGIRKGSLAKPQATASTESIEQIAEIISEQVI